MRSGPDITFLVLTQPLNHLNRRTRAIKYLHCIYEELHREDSTRIKIPENILQSINLYTGNKKNQVFTSSLLLVSVSWTLSTAGIRIGLQREVTSNLGRIRFPFSLSFLLVRSEVEGDEEKEARADNNNTSKSGKLLSSILAGVGHLGKYVEVKCVYDAK